MAAVERAAQVDVDDGIPVLDGEDRPVALGHVDAGREDTDVDPTMTFDDPVDDRSDGHLVGHVEGLGTRRAPSCGDAFDDRLQRLAAAARHDDRTAGLGQLERSRLTDSGACPGNPRHLSVQILHARDARSMALRD